MDAIRFKILERIANINDKNVEDVFDFFYERFLYLNSDEVLINLTSYSGAKREFMLLSDEDGEPNLKGKTVTMSKTKDGFPLTEKDFIKSELKFLTLENLKPKSITEEKQFELYFDYLQNKLQQIPTLKDNQTDNPNPFPRIFKTNHAFHFFESLESIIVKKPLADYSFIFRRMQKDGFIFSDIKESEFRDFLVEQNKVVEIDKLKLLEYCTTLHKESAYTSKKTAFPLL